MLFALVIQNPFLFGDGLFIYFSTCHRVYDIVEASTMPTPMKCLCYNSCIQNIIRDPGEIHFFHCRFLASKNKRRYRTCILMEGLLGSPIFGVALLEAGLKGPLHSP